MVIFASEAELVRVLDRADEIIRACVAGSLELRPFLEELGHLHNYYAFDGHESDEEELKLLDRHKERIVWVERVLEELFQVCADEDATKEIYIKAGRFGSVEALRRLRVLVENRNAQR